MSEPVGYLATNPTHPLNANKLVWEPENWHITWEFKPLYLHPDPRVAELEAVLRECREELNGILKGKYSGNADKAIAKIDEALNVPDISRTA